MNARRFLAAAALCAVAAAVPCGAQAASLRIARTCSGPRTLALGGGLVYTDGGFWTYGGPNRNAVLLTAPSKFVRFSARCSITQVTSPAKFRLTGALIAGLNNQLWASGDNDSTFENVGISGTHATVYPVDGSSNYLYTLAIVGGRALGSIEGGALQWWTGPGSDTQVSFPSAPGGASSLAAADGGVWMSVEGYEDAPGTLGFLAAGAGDVSLITAGVSSGFGPAEIVASGGKVWMIETDASNDEKLATVSGPGGTVSEFPIPTGSADLVASPDGQVWVENSTASKLMRLGPTGAVTETLSAPSGYRIAGTGIGGGYLGVLLTQPNNGDGAGASKLLLIH